MSWKRCKADSILCSGGYSPSVPKTSRTSLPFPPPLHHALSATTTNESKTHHPSSCAPTNLSYPLPLSLSLSLRRSSFSVLLRHSLSPLRLDFLLPCRGRHSCRLGRGCSSSLHNDYSATTAASKAAAFSFVPVVVAAYFSAHALDPLLDSLFCHEIFTNIQDGGIILPAFRRKSTSHPTQPTSLFLLLFSLSLSFSFCP